MPVGKIPPISKELARRLREMDIAFGFVKESPAQRKRRKLREFRTSAERKKVFLTPLRRKQAKKLLTKAYAVDIACGIKPIQLITYAYHYPNRFFVGIEDIAVKKDFRQAIAKLPNARLIKIDAREALSLIPPNSKRLINMSNFPHFESGVERLAPFRKQILQKAFAALAPGGTLALTTTQMELAKKELIEAGFKLGKPRWWGEGKLDARFASTFTQSMMGRVLGNRPELILAKKPRA